MSARRGFLHVFHFVLSAAVRLVGGEVVAASHARVRRRRNFSKPGRGIRTTWPCRNVGRSPLSHHRVTVSTLTFNSSATWDFV